MSVLAHVVHGAQQPEPAATQALAYILKSHPVLTRSVVDLLRVANIEFEPGRVDAELVFEDSQPDLTIFDDHGHLRVFVENKFWAGLTEAQPVSYLEKLSVDPPSALMFVVPQQRVPTVWNELEQRCIDDGLEWKAAPNGSNKEYRAFVNDKALLLVSWKTVLDRLCDAAGSEGLDSAKHDLTQLQGLVNSVNLGAFLPLQLAETNNQEVPNRLINYIDLISPIVTELVQADFADVKGLTFAASVYDTGRFFRIHSHKTFNSWIGIPLKRWRNEGISPLWCRIRGNGLNANHFQTIPSLFKDIRTNGEEVWFPIRLKAGVEREKVVDSAVAQIKRIRTEVLSNITE